MAANLPELYKNNAGQTGERDVLYTALMPLKSEFTKKPQDISIILVQRQFIMCTESENFHLDSLAPQT